MIALFQGIGNVGDEPIMAAAAVEHIGLSIVDDRFGLELGVAKSDAGGGFHGGPAYGDGGLLQI